MPRVDREVHSLLLNRPRALINQGTLKRILIQVVDEGIVFDRILLVLIFYDDV